MTTFRTRRIPNSLAKEIHLERLADDAHVRGVTRSQDRRRRRRVDALRRCCVGSRAAFEKLLADRQSLSEPQLRKIIDRLAEVIQGGEGDHASA